MLSQAQSQNASNKGINAATLEDSPADSVSSISWASKATLPTFATSDWASAIRIYEFDSNSTALTQKTCFDTESPCLSVRWHDDETRVFAGCADGFVKVFDVASGRSEEIGKHDGPVKSVHWLPSANALLTLSVDKTLRFWDPRQDGHVAGFRLDYQVYCSDLLYPYLAVGMSDQRILIADLRDAQAELTGRNGRRIDYLESPLGSKTEIATIKLFSRGESYGIGIGGNDARCHLSRLEMRQDLSKKLEYIVTFKAHKLDGSLALDVPRKYWYPVNSLGFYPNRGSDFLYTAIGAGKLNFWDLKKKDMIVDFDFKDIPVTQAEIDPSGKYMAFALGYDWARGIEGYMSKPTKVCVHVLQDKELEFQYKGDKNYPIKYA